jgi:hypothetical protein
MTTFPLLVRTDCSSKKGKKLAPAEASAYQTSLIFVQIHLIGCKHRKQEQYTLTYIPSPLIEIRVAFGFHKSGRCGSARIRFAIIRASPSSPHHLMVAASIRI